MERKKITFDSFYPRCHTRCHYYRHPYALQASKRRIAAILHRMAHCLSDIPPGHLFPVQIAQNRVISIFCALFSILIVGGTAFYLLVPPMMDEFVRVKDLVIDYFFQRNPRRQCAQNTL